MKTHRFIHFALSGFLLGCLFSCATPVAPTGGPADEDGPFIENTFPETGTTNFDGRIFEFQFNEFVNRNSVPGAITVEPDLGIEYDISWKRTKLTIEFKDRFPDSTTVILKLSTDISDTRNNKMARPVTLAISTGDEIDSGQIQGRVLLANNGDPATERKVLLYRQPFDLRRKATYEARTDTGGYFNFTYLAEGNYKALLVDDRNRNKIWDRGAESAYPFFKEIINLEKAGKDTLDVLYTSQVDSIAPVLQGIGLFSMNRMRLRFSENVMVQDSPELIISDSLGNRYSTAYPLYVSKADAYVLYAQSEYQLTENGQYLLSISGITDLAGNAADTSGFSFSGTAQEDTTRQRIIASNGKNGLLQHEDFMVTYAAPITQPEIIDSVVVIEGNIDFDDWPAIETEKNQLFIKPQGEWIEDVEYQFMVWNPVTNRRTLFEPEIWDSTEYGEIEIQIQDSDSSAMYQLQLLDSDGQLKHRNRFNTSITLNNLPPLSYILIVYRDENENEKWDRGTPVPYKAPERYYVQKKLSVQEGFTSEVKITFQ